MAANIPSQCRLPMYMSKVLFEEITYQVDLVTVGDGTVLLNDVDQIKDDADFGSTVTLEITPDTGWQLDSIVMEEFNRNAGGRSCDPILPAAPIPSPMPAEDVTVTVTLVKKVNNIDTFAISYTGPDHGVIDALLDGSAEYGEVVTVVADPDDGYRFKSIAVKTADDTYIAAAFVSEDEDYVTTYSFEMPASAVEIYVTFEKYAPSGFTDVRTDDWYYDAVVRIGSWLLPRDYNGTLWTEGHDDPCDVCYRSWQNRRCRHQLVCDLYLHRCRYQHLVWTVCGMGGTRRRCHGYGNDLFGPEDNVTREQMALIMYRTLNGPAGI